MNEPRNVHCKKLGRELPALRFKPFTDEFGQMIFDNVSQEAWQMWLTESPRYINTAGVDLQSEDGQAFLRKQMRIFFGFEEGENLDTAWVPPEA
ncbi:MAG: oxidative damage protection protein [Nannocystaceae bacterium]|nr:oxidative damage protection protein [Nannocystaceae bacterium]